MTIDEGFAYIEGLTNLERTPAAAMLASGASVRPPARAQSPAPSMRPYRLDRMRRLLDAFGRPERSFNTVHVAGSKGKGSTSAFIASILQAAGFKTGLYVSPHVSSYKERITHAGKEIADEALISEIERIKDRIAAIDPSELPGGSRPTTFEVLTLLAFLVFKRTVCDWAVIETGIGGRLDATNLVSPRAVVLTPVELEHTEILGETIELIAAEKAGIIKDGVPVFVGYQHPEAERTFLIHAAEKSAPVVTLRDSLINITTEHESGTGQRVTFLWSSGTSDTALIRMLGTFQAENAALAWIACSSLFEDTSLHPAARKKALVEGLASAFLPGRMELINKVPPIMIDGAHTPASVKRLAETFSALSREPRVLIFGSVLGKNAAAMAEILSPYFAHIIVSTPGTFKKSDPLSVYEHFRARRASAEPTTELSTELIPDPESALRRALEIADGKHPILAAGSFYMISEIRKCVAAPTLRSGS